MSATPELKQILTVNEKQYEYYSIAAATELNIGALQQLPCSLKILLENLLRHFDAKTVTIDDIKAFGQWLKHGKSNHEIAYRPARVLMQDFTGVPAIVDLAAMRSAMQRLNADPEKINPLIPVDLVIDHSVQVDQFANKDALQKNIELEMQRNHERYQFLRWGQTAFSNFRVVPPGTGICHQVNLEYLAQVVWKNSQQTVVYPDTLVGTDSHTTMINGLGVLGWGVGGIEAEAAMLGQAISMLIPEVIGVKLIGELPEGIIATDLVLTITEILRQHGVVGKFVEFFGPGLQHLPLADRATIANMAPEYGATCGFFPVDQETLNYLSLTARAPEQIELVKAYSQAQGLWHAPHLDEAKFTATLTVDLSSIEPSIAGPKRPQDRVPIHKLRTEIDTILQHSNKKSTVAKSDYELTDGDVVIAAITSCTNTSNPSALIAAGLVAKNAYAKGIMTKPWVKTSLAPGSKVVTDYLDRSGLQTFLDKQGFFLVGYGCTTCIGNSGPLDPEITNAITEADLTVASVLSGNRNFEGRVHPLTKINWLASPALVVAYALAGSMRINLNTDPIAHNAKGEAIYLKDIWPSNAEIQQQISKFVTEDIFKKQYANVFAGDEYWQNMQIAKDKTYHWDSTSTYVQQPDFFTDLTAKLPELNDINDAHILAMLGDSITTDHISPAGNIKSDSPAGKYLTENNVAIKDFNSYGSRRGNHQVLLRGTFANIRIRNEMTPEIEGGYTSFIPTATNMSIYDAAMLYQQQNIPLVVIAGKEYGTGSSRDWAAKGSRLLGIKAVIAESYERIHRSNLIGMGVLPLQFIDTNRKELNLTGSEKITITGIATIQPQSKLNVKIEYTDQKTANTTVLCRIDTQNELTYFKNGGILHYVLRQLLKA